MRENRTMPTFAYNPPHFDPSCLFSRDMFEIERADPPPFVRETRIGDLVIGLTADGHFWVCEETSVADA